MADARSRGDIDVVICDTAGRLHTAYGLMDELTECQRAIRKACGGGESGAHACMSLTFDQFACMLLTSMGGARLTQVPLPPSSHAIDVDRLRG